MTRPIAEADDDALKSWTIGIAAAREMLIRKRQILPDASKPVEVRWAAAGVCSPAALDTVRVRKRERVG